DYKASKGKTFPVYCYIPAIGWPVVSNQVTATLGSRKKSGLPTPISNQSESESYQQIPKPVTSESTTTFFHLDHCKNFLSSLPPSYSPKSSFLHISQVIFLAFLCSKPASGFPFLCAFTVYEVLDNLALDYGSALPSTTLPLIPSNSSYPTSLLSSACQPSSYFVVFS
ncbi:hypothetical protein MG293_001741, partial [Ovis ammon polii]